MRRQEGNNATIARSQAGEQADGRPLNRQTSSEKAFSSFSLFLSSSTNSCRSFDPKTTSQPASRHSTFSVLNLPSQRQIHLPNPPPTIKMKFFLALAAAAIAVANAADCDLVKVAPLLTDVDVKQCSKDTGFSPPTPPTAAILPKLCGNTACQAALGKLKALGLGDCSALGVKLESELINPIEAFCHPTTPSVNPSPTTGTPTSGTPTSGTPSTSAPTTTKPAC